MSSILNREEVKLKCQKFSPSNLVETMLDMAGYERDVVGKRVLENSFGSGNILKAILHRYIKDCLKNKMTSKEIAYNISNDIYGIELDQELYEKCIVELDEIAKSYGVFDVNWSLYNQDALRWETNLSFDFIIGNPPYISYRDIDAENRVWVKKNYDTCSVGKFDYCYAFIELGVKLLSDSGKLVQLVPSNIYKNVFGAKMRSLLQPHIKSIYEYPDKKLFGDTLTSSSIFVYDKSYCDMEVRYINVTAGTELVLNRETLKDKWIFGSKSPTTKKGVRFGSRYHASSVVATLYNKAFLLIEENNSGELIEDKLIRPAASPKGAKRGKKEYIIFPYYYDDNILQHYTSDEFCEKFPLATLHLQAFKASLDARNSDRNVEWFEYGRSQALAHINQPKLMLSTVITNNVEVYLLDDKTIPYSGIYVIPLDKKYSLKDAKKMLESDQFKEYVQRCGVSVSGKSKRITSKDINNFVYYEENVDGATEICN